MPRSDLRVVPSIIAFAFFAVAAGLTSSWVEPGSVAIGVLLGAGWKRSATPSSRPARAPSGLSEHLRAVVLTFGLAALFSAIVYFVFQRFNPFDAVFDHGGGNDLRRALAITVTTAAGTNLVCDVLDAQRDRRPAGESGEAGASSTGLK